MRILILNIVFILALGTTETIKSSQPYSPNSNELNNTTLNQIEGLIRKKAGAELKKNNENSFILNGYNVYTEVIVRRFGLNVYEESFYNVENPDKMFRIRIVEDLNGDRELAIMIHGKDGAVSYHACFDITGNMLQENPWGKNEEYSIEIFDLYNKYRTIYEQSVGAINNKQQDSKIFLTEN